MFNMLFIIRDSRQTLDRYKCTWHVERYVRDNLLNNITILPGGFTLYEKRSISKIIEKELKIPIRDDGIFFKKQNVETWRSFGLRIALTLQIAREFYWGAKTLEKALESGCKEGNYNTSRDALTVDEVLQNLTPKRLSQTLQKHPELKENHPSNTLVWRCLLSKVRFVGKKNYLFFNAESSSFVYSIKMATEYKTKAAAIVSIGNKIGKKIHNPKGFSYKLPQGVTIVKC